MCLLYAMHCILQTLPIKYVLKNFSHNEIFEVFMNLRYTVKPR